MLPSFGFLPISPDNPSSIWPDRTTDIGGETQKRRPPGSGGRLESMTKELRTLDQRQMPLQTVFAANRRRTPATARVMKPNKAAYVEGSGITVPTN